MGSMRLVEYQWFMVTAHKQKHQMMCFIYLILNIQSKSESCLYMLYASSIFMFSFNCQSEVIIFSKDVLHTYRKIQTNVGTCLPGGMTAERKLFDLGSILDILNLSRNRTIHMYALHVTSRLRLNILWLNVQILDISAILWGLGCKHFWRLQPKHLSVLKTLAILLFFYKN